MNQISAKIIADSINEFGNRITSFELNIPRIVLAEFNTHRMISRNSASSRAVPFKTMLKKVEEEPFIPIKWQKDHTGMQGTEYFTESEVIDLNIEHNWLNARDMAIESATFLSEQNITKQLCNRLLEPFMYHKVIATATEWENFTALRADEPAEIHIQDVAYKMIDELNLSIPKILKAGEWHIPFGDQFDNERLQAIATKIAIDNNWIDLTEEEYKPIIQDIKIKIATARCARVSYINYEGKDDYEADLKLYERLSGMGHWSCFEHCAQSMTNGQYEEADRKSIYDSEGNKIGESLGWSGNFQGFIQLRKTFENENRQDSRIIKFEEYAEKE